MLTKGRLVGSLYILDDSCFVSSIQLTPCAQLLTSNIHSAGMVTSSTLWHDRFGHASTTILKHIPFLSHLTFIDVSVCPVCPLAKLAHLPFPPSHTRATAPFDLIHVNLWGPYRHPSISNAHYMLTVSPPDA